MQLLSFLALGLGASDVCALLRFSCSGLVTERLDPLVNPGVKGLPHLHQIIGGNAFNVTMDPKADISTMATCTTCTFSEDISNYWTAVLYFRARNGTFKRVPQIGNQNFEAANWGMTIYYSPYTAKGIKTTAFQKGFRMLVGDPSLRNKEGADKYRQLTYTCLKLQVLGREKRRICQINLVRLESWRTSGFRRVGMVNFENNGPCPSTHPVKIPQLFFEVVWDTRKFNDKSLWPIDGSQPFVWSYGDATGCGTHGDYVFGWKGDSLQKAMDSNCNINCPALKTQSIADANKCSLKSVVTEDIDSWLTELPGGMPVVE
ncbi:hypothetical protein HYALB_00000592 [Hymenoscyphus albidus]|uniref:DUF1996 domain-containing protein n=1 Tax=Hymenoscyphus albidus TaxID=595503 RepID=A0A9N9M3F8_9HELO|nr:hypothetical protein HYALB_00000592 [Hymenoscyphus albidus]